MAEAKRYLDAPHWRKAEALARELAALLATACRTHPTECCCEACFLLARTYNTWLRCERNAADLEAGRERVWR